MAKRKPTAEYMRQLVIGQQYEAFIKTFFENKLGITLHFHETEEAQYKGENEEGYEIKFDIKSLDTPNLYFETHEKVKGDKLTWKESGVNRADNTLFYCIGNTTEFFIFKKEKAKELTEIYKERIKQYLPTSTGCLVSKGSVLDHCDMHFVFDGSEQGLQELRDAVYNYQIEIKKEEQQIQKTSIDNVLGKLKAKMGK